MVLTQGVYQTPVEEALSEATLPLLVELLDVPAPWDVDNISASMLAYLADTLVADAWTGGTATDAYLRSVVKGAIRLHLYRGTPLALRSFAELAGFSILWVLTRSGTPARNRGIDVYITPSIFQEATTTWIAYVTAVLERLVPYWISINFVSVVPTAEGTVYSAGTMRMKDFQRLGAE